MINIVAKHPVVSFDDYNSRLDGNGNCVGI